MGKPYCMPFCFARCVNSVHGVCVWMVTILQIETFVAFNFDPSLIARLITDSDLD